MRAKTVTGLIASIYGENYLKSRLNAELQQIGIEDITIEDIVETKDGLEITAVSNDDEVTFLLTVGEDGLEAIVYGEDEDDELNYAEYVDLSDFNADVYDDYSIGSVNFEMIPLEVIFYLLTGEILDTDEVSEATITVIRGGKKVKKTLKRKKRPKPLNAKKRAGIRKAVLKRKKKAQVSKRKRKKSLLLRNRSNLKTKPKRFRV